MLLGSETVKRVSPGVESYHRLANIGSTFQALSMKWTRKEKSTGHRPATRAEKSTLMRAKGSSVSRDEMLAHLTDKGLLGGESKPMKRLAIYLTKAKKDKIFCSDGSGNWYLA